MITHREQNEFIERNIVTGLITSTEYLQQVESMWDSLYIESTYIRQIAAWCWDYYREYHEAPQSNIQTIYTQKLKQGLSDEHAELIEMILNGVSKDFNPEQFNVDYLLDETEAYFTEQKLEIHASAIQDDLDQGNLSDAQNRAINFRTLEKASQTVINPFERSPIVRNQVRKAFEERQDPLVKFPGALGQFMNAELTRDAFVAYLGEQKIGKTWWLIELTMRSLRSGCNVAFFQAGDLSKRQMIRRLGIYLLQTSDEERYCQPMLVPVRDCLYNQLDQCDRDVRESDFGIFTHPDEVTYEHIVKFREEYPEYKACRNCEYLKGSPWLEMQPAVSPITWKDAYKAFRKFDRKHRSEYRLATYPNDTLTINEMNVQLDRWEREEGFIADVIIDDYLDIHAPEPETRQLQFRHQENTKWKKMRRLSQERHALVISASQAASSAFGKHLLTKSDFSEDRRKFDHTTAFWGLNQTPEEKQIGLMRINELVLRESDFDQRHPITVLQRLQKGRPFLGSYF